MHEFKKLKAGRGSVGKTPVAGIKDRETNQVDAKVVEATDAPTLQSNIRAKTDRTAIIYTDDASAHIGLPRHHETVQHSVGEFVKNMAHTNGMESFWALLKRGYIGIYHWMSNMHLDRYVAEFEGPSQQPPQGHAQPNGRPGTWSHRQTAPVRGPDSRDGNDPHRANSTGVEQSAKLLNQGLTGYIHR